MLFNNVVIIFIILIFIYIITYQFIPDENLVSKDHYIQSNILSHVSDNNIYNRQYIIDNQEGTFLKKEYNVSLLSQPRNNCIPPSTYDYNTNTCTCPPGSSYDITKGCISLYVPEPSPYVNTNTCKPGYTLDKTLNTCVSLCSSNEHFDPINNVCVADCQYGDWDSWSSCVSNSNIRTRTRKTTAPKNGGNTCAPKIETDTSFCPIDCIYDNWGNWSSCTTDNPTITRTRVTYQPINNGATCGPGWNVETDNSTCPIGCQYGTWSDWSACQTGNSNRTRTRTLTQPINGGAACPVSGTTETQTDNSTCAVGCQYGSWSEWSACQTGNSNRTRTRTLTQPINGGTACPVSGTTETETDSLTCPIGCKYGDWSAWSGCQSGNPNRTRTRTLTQPINGGAACPISGTIETQTDSLTCPVDCQYDWTNSWSNCTASCDGGTQYKDPKISVQPKNNGKKCPDRISQSCNTQRCIRPFNGSSYRENGWTWDGRVGQPKVLDMQDVNCGSQALKTVFLEDDWNGDRWHYKYNCANGNAITGLYYKNEGWNAYLPGGEHSDYLSQYNINCDGNSVLTRFKMERKDDDHSYYNYTCGNTYNNMNCRNAYTNWNRGGNMVYVDSNMHCADNEAIKGFQLENSNGSVRYRYTCCSPY